MPLALVHAAAVVHVPAPDSMQHTSPLPHDGEEHAAPAFVIEKSPPASDEDDTE